MRDGPARRAYAGTPRPSGRPTQRSIVIGRLSRAHRVEADPVAVDVDPAAAVEAAFTAVSADLDRLAGDLRAQGLTEPAQIVEATGLIARDPALRAAVDERLTAGLAPMAAVAEATEQFARVLADLDDPLLASRAADVRAVGRRLTAAFGPPPTDNGASTDRIVVGWEVTADDLLLDAATVVGALSVIGGATAHAGIVARSLGIPMLFGVDPAVLEVADGTEVMLDTGSGRVVVAPDEAERLLAKRDAASVRANQALLASGRTASLSTRDGVRVVVQANVASAFEARLAVSMAAPGVGLLRTEMPFLAATAWPRFDEHLARLTPVLAPLAGLPVTVRTLDFAADKQPTFLRAGENGSALELMLAEPMLLGAQLRAIIQCGLSVGVAASIMFPMVDSATTLRRCRALAEAAAAELGAVAPPIGAMVESREAVAEIEDLAEAADFLSIGTNDLTAAILGLGRRDPALTTARLRDPDVLDAIARTVAAGKARDCPVSVCGDAASDPDLVPTLLGLGCRTLSVAPSVMDEVRAAVREYREP